MFKFSNFVTPGTIYHGTITGSRACGAGEEGRDGNATPAAATADAKGQGPSITLKVFRETKVPGICADDFETKQVGGVVLFVFF